MTVDNTTTTNKPIPNGNSSQTSKNASLQNDWNEVKTKLKSRFSKLTDDGIDSMNNDMDLLSGKLQSVYGYGKDQADRESASFRASVKTTDSTQSRAV